MSSGVGTETGEPKGLLLSSAGDRDRSPALLVHCRKFSLSLKLRGIHFSLDSLHAHPDQFLIVYMRAAGAVTTQMQSTCGRAKLCGDSDFLLPLEVGRTLEL